MKSGNGTSVVLGLQRATHHTLHALEVALAGLGLTPSELNVLANLGDGGARNVRALAVDTGTKATTLTGVLDRLENHGYLTRELDPADRRSFRLNLTEAGRDVADRVRRAVAALEGAALRGISGEQLAGFHAVLAALEGGG